jgi:hypothetical protein
MPGERLSRSPTPPSGPRQLAGCRPRRRASRIRTVVSTPWKTGPERREGASLQETARGLGAPRN